MSFSQFFKEPNGQLSMTRLLTFVLVVTAIFIAFSALWLVFAGKVITDLTYLISVLLGFGLGAKVTQSFTEKDKTTNIN